jgi:hypothetical protein
MLGSSTLKAGRGGKFGPFTDYLNSADKCQEMVSNIVGYYNSLSDEDTGTSLAGGFAIQAGNYCKAIQTHFKACKKCNSNSLLSKAMDEEWV